MVVLIDKNVFPAQTIWKHFSLGLKATWGDTSTLLLIHWFMQNWIRAKATVEYNSYVNPRFKNQEAPVMSTTVTQVQPIKLVSWELQRTKTLTFNSAHQKIQATLQLCHESQQTHCKARLARLAHLKLYNDVATAIPSVQLQGRLKRLHSSWVGCLENR